MSQWSPTTALNYGNLGEQSHVVIVAEHLLPMMREHRRDAAGTMLDFGCGEGHLGTRLALMANLQRVLCIDQSQELLRIARRHAAEAGVDGRFAFRHGDESALPTRERFDFVLCSLMLMMCETRARLDRAIAGLIGSVQRDGLVLIVLTHPCFREAVHATFHNDLPVDFQYWQSGRPYRVVLDPDVQQVTTTFHDYHWTLADYAAAIRDGGGVIKQMLELPGQYDADGRPLANPAYLVLCVQPR